MTIICSVCEMFTWKCPRCPQQLELLQPTEFQLLQVVPDCGMSEPLVLPNNFIDHFFENAGQTTFIFASDFLILSYSLAWCRTDPM